MQSSFSFISISYYKVMSQPLRFLEHQWRLEHQLVKGLTNRVVVPESL